MKRIYISDVVHEQLKREAKAEGRTLQWVVEARLTGVPAETTPSPKNTDLSNLPDSMQNSLTCPQCGMTTYNMTDIERKYCANCHQFHSDMKTSPVEGSIEMVERYEKPEIKKSEATPLPTTSVSDLIAQPFVPAHVSTGELACCVNEMKPCKHWVWDVTTGEGYKNSLSGRLMEVE